MFVSVNFPIADFRGLRGDKCGRLDRPSWGSVDPRAAFARGFGAIHTRNKSSNGFIGENYYADCRSFIKYPTLIFVKSFHNSEQKILAYPIYRRLFFDGQFAGRFEFGFRLNEGTIEAMRLTHPSAKYDILQITTDLLATTIVANLLDRRSLDAPFYQAAPLLRDGYIMSSTSNKGLLVHNVASVGSVYVSVGAPFVFIRSGIDTPIASIKRKRNLLQGDGFSLFQTHSGMKEQSFNTVVLESTRDLMSESPQERLARLFYSQIRVITFVHSYYLAKLDEGKSLT